MDEYTEATENTEAIANSMQAQCQMDTENLEAWNAWRNNGADLETGIQMFHNQANYGAAETFDY